MKNQDNEYFDSRLYNISYGIEKVMEIINNLDNEKIDLTNVNSVMELYNICDVLVDEKYLNDKQLYKFKDYTYKMNSIINDYFNALSFNKICDDLNKVDLTYKIDYIELLIKRKVYEKLDRDVADEFLGILGCHPNIYLKFKGFVDYFTEEIKKRIIDTNIFTEVYIDERYYDKKESIALPKLNDTEIGEMLTRYVKDKDANPNYLNKILNIKDFNKYEIVQFEAYERKRNIFKSMFESQNGVKTRVELRGGDELTNGTNISTEFNDQRILLTYNTKDLEKNLDYATLLNHFIYLFEFVDFRTMLCNLVYKTSEDGTIDKLSVEKGKYVYFTNYYFNVKDMKSYVQMVFYLDFLEHNNIKINDIVRWFFTKYISEEFNIKDFEITISDNCTLYYEKCKDLVTVFDEIKKQYYIWVKYDRLDRKLVELNTKPIKFAEIPSKNFERYYYNESLDVSKEINMLFSDQSMLFYIERFKNKYFSLYTLLLNEKIELGDFYDYQKSSIEWLMKRGTLITENGYIRFNINKVLLLRLLYEDGVIVLTKFSKNEVIKVLRNEKFRIENTLLTKYESEYFDYFLNDRYTNGKHIRNKYTHSTASKDEELCKQDYHTIIRLIIILIIKINDDLCDYHDKDSNI